MFINWGRKNSCGHLHLPQVVAVLEMMQTGAPKHDFARFGMEVYRASPRQADVIVVALGTIVYKDGSCTETSLRTMRCQN